MCSNRFVVGNLRGLLEASSLFVGFGSGALRARPAGPVLPLAGGEGASVRPRVQLSLKQEFSWFSLAVLSHLRFHLHLFPDPSPAPGGAPRPVLCLLQEFSCYSPDSYTHSLLWPCSSFKNKSKPLFFT